MHLKGTHLIVDNHPKKAVLILILCIPRLAVSLGHKHARTQLSYQVCLHKHYINFFRLRLKTNISFQIVDFNYEFIKEEFENDNVREVILKSLFLTTFKHW